MQIPKIDKLIYSKRKSVGLSVTEEGLLVVRAPKRLPQGVIEAAVREKAAWIVKKQEESRTALLRFPPHLYAEGESFLFLGESVVLHYSANAKKTFAVGGVLFVPEKKRETAAQAVEAWYKAEARACFTARLDFYARLMGVSYASLRLSSAVTRWGSCGPEGTINLAWRLVAAPREQVDYVAVHELAHLKRRDHSAAFWAEVERVLPDYKERRKALKAFSPLMRGQ